MITRPDNATVYALFVRDDNKTQTMNEQGGRLP